MPLAPKADGSQPRRVLEFIRNGRYLEKPGEATIAYVSGLLLTLVVLVSGLVAFCALLALAWRVLDVPVVREALTFGETDRQGLRHWWNSKERSDRNSGR